MRRTGAVELHDFSESLLITELGKRPPVRYLFGYLNTLKARAVLIEQHYVDRHFVDDFAWYYARAFNTPDAHCKRFHFFDELSRDDLNRLLDTAFNGERAAAEKSLQKSYLGFVVVRPLALAPLGRTVLRTYDSDNDRRHYEVVRKYRVNISGLRLHVDGLAYQQQDRGAAVCASTALWSALQQVASLDGQRTPTPSAITRAAVSPFPASYGLNPVQMGTALTNLGYSADYFVPDGDTTLFRAKLVSCLHSRLPVLLLLKNESGGSGHAVAVTGFSDPRNVVDVSVTTSTKPIRMKAGAADVLYVHDDNLGSHAHYELFDKQKPSSTGAQLMLRRGRSGKSTPWWKPDELVVFAALVPKPAKLRLTIEALLRTVLQYRPVLEAELAGLDLHFGARFTTGVRYRDELFDMPLDREQLRAFQEGLSLPRHVGVITVSSNTERLLDLIVDVSVRQASSCPVRRFGKR